MLRTGFALVAVALCSGVFVQQSIAGPLTSAEVTKIINRVSLIEPAKGARPAALRDVIKDDLGLQTGARSRSELLFQDNTLTRVGAETYFSFKTGTRDLTLEKGSMLLQVPKGLGGAKIHTAAVTAAITGTTIMMEYSPRQYLKVLVLEGSLRLSRNGSFGDSVVLHPGKMVIMRPDAKKIPDPVDVDLAEIVRTSTLVNFPGSNILPSMPLIQAAINDQAKDLTRGTLVPTNLVMGHGTNVVLASSDQLSKTIGSLAGLTTSHNGAPAAATISTATSTAANNVLGSGPAVSVSSSAQLVSLLGNAAPGSGGTINIPPAAVNVGGNVAGSVSAGISGGSVNASANVSLGGNQRVVGPPSGH
jgi:FecR protein